MDKDEEFTARTAAAAEVTTRLKGRGIAVTGAERPEELVDLLSAVERFEKAVEGRGGDLMVDDLKSSRPDDRHFVVPKRARGTRGCRAALRRRDRLHAGSGPPTPSELLTSRSSGASDSPLTIPPVLLIRSVPWPASIAAMAPKPASPVPGHWTEKTSCPDSPARSTPP